MTIELSLKTKIQEAFEKREVKQFLVRDFVAENYGSK